MVKNRFDLLVCRMIDSIIVKPGSGVEWRLARLDGERDLLKAFLEQDPYQNIYLLGALENGMIGAAETRLWAAWMRDRLVGALLLAKDLNLTYAALYSAPDCLDRLRGLRLDRMGVHLVLGQATEVDMLIESLPKSSQRRVDTFHFSRIYPEDFHPVDPGPARMATQQDVDRLVEIYQQYPLDGYRGEQIRQSVQGFLRGTGFALVEMNGEIVSVLRVNTETHSVGLLGGGYTLPDYRRRGYYEAVNSLMHRELLRKGKIGVSFHRDDNHPIHTLMQKIGAREIGEWKILRLGTRPKLTGRLRKRFSSLLRRLQRLQSNEPSYTIQTRPARFAGNSE